jgi:hypothetical protein
MVSSKLKNDSKKNNLNFDNITIDAKHNEIIDKFNNDKNLIPQLKNELNELIEEYKSSKNNSLKNNSEYIIERSIKKDKIYKLKNRINKIISNQEINNYYLNVGNLLHEYYKNVDSSTNNKIHSDIEDFEENLLNYNKDTKESNKKNKKQQKSVIDFFNNRMKDNSESQENVNTNENDIENESNYTSMKISDFIQEESKFKKKNFLDDYLKKTDPNYISTLKVDNSIFKCELCENEMTLYPSDGIQICTECGYQEYVVIESDKPSFKDPPLEVCYFSYKRINHFNEWLAQFQAKESTEIPDEVYEKIIAEIKKERITNLEKLDTKKIRAYLKKNKLNKFYDHAAHILYQINGISPPHMSKELEEKLRLMFKEIQGPFMEVCPKWRKNFLNYSYVLHKFVELLSLDEYKVYFPLLKDREKLHQTDMIWKKICEKIGWHFIKSI